MRSRFWYNWEGETADKRCYVPDEWCQLIRTSRSQKPLQCRDFLSFQDLASWLTNQKKKLLMDLLSVLGQYLGFNFIRNRNLKCNSVVITVLVEFKSQLVSLKVDEGREAYQGQYLVQTTGTTTDLLPSTVTSWSCCHDFLLYIMLSSRIYRQ